jgi:hypothetical protein
MRALMSAPDAEVVRVQEVDPAPPALARMEPSQPAPNAARPPSKAAWSFLTASLLPGLRDRGEISRNVLARFFFEAGMLKKVKRTLTCAPEIV